MPRAMNHTSASVYTEILENVGEIHDALICSETSLKVDKNEQTLVEPI